MRKARRAIFMRVTDEEYHKMKIMAESYDMTMIEMVKFWAFGVKEGPKRNMGLKAKSLQA